MEASLDCRSIPGKMASWGIRMSNGLSFQNRQTPVNISDTSPTLSWWTATVVLNQINNSGTYSIITSMQPFHPVPSKQLQFLTRFLICTNYIHSSRCSYYIHACSHQSAVSVFKTLGSTANIPLYVYMYTSFSKRKKHVTQNTRTSITITLTTSLLPFMSPERTFSLQCEF